MTPYSFIFIILTIYLSFIFHPSHGFEVIQPQNRTVNPDGSASISCEHTADVKDFVKDIRLNSISLTNESAMLCQRGKTDCQNITMYQQSTQKWLFIILNIEPEAMDMTYQCEFTVKILDLDDTKTGTPTRLLPGQKETTCTLQSPPPPQPQSHQLRWILIGLLALVLLYSCVITSFYIKLRCNNRDPENSVYVEMRKAPPPRNPHPDIYCG